MTPEQLIERWLQARLPAATAAWLQESARKLRGGSDKDLYLAVSLVQRKVGKDDLAPTPQQLQEVGAARAG
jgi:hypothetical protein